MKFLKRLHLSWWTIGILIGSLILLLPFIKPGFFVSDDGEWMVIRLSAFFQSLREGQFPVRFLGRLNHSYGYPVANFLYPGFLYIGSFLHILGFSFVDSIKLIFVGSVILGAIFLFHWLKNFFSAKSSFWGTLGFLFSPYLFFDLYKRGSVGEVLATAAIIIALWSVERGFAWVIPLAIGVLVLAHNSLALLFFLFFVLYLFVRKRGGLLLPAFIGLGSSTFFWFPAILEQKFVLFPTLKISNPGDYFIDKAMLQLVGFGFVLAFALVFKKGTRGSLRKFFLWTFGVSSILAMSLSLFVWNFPIIVKLFQFPFRFLSLGLIAGPWLVAQAIEESPTQACRRIVWVLIVLWAIPIVLSLQSMQFIARSEGYYTTNEGTTTVANEYMPRWVRETPRDRGHQRLVFFQGKGTMKSTVMSTQKIDALIYAEEPSILQINSIYYPGWGITVDDQFVVPDYQNVYGLMRVSVLAGKHTVKAEFRETIPRFMADAVSIISLIAYFIYIVWSRQRSVYKKFL